jgi:hypothetical protein
MKKNSIFKRINSFENFGIKYCIIATAEALYNVLSKSEEVIELKKGYESGKIKDKEIKKFTEKLLKDLNQGTLFPHDIEICAIICALRDSETHFAKSYINDSSLVRISGILMFPRIAKIVIREVS